jgi:hypothetical protein
MPSWAYELAAPKLPFQKNCANDEGFGDITFVIDGIDYDLPSKHWMEKYESDGISFCTSLFSSLDIYQEEQENLFIVGDIFMQVWYTIFDRENNQVGFAEAIHDGVEQPYDDAHYQADIESGLADIVKATVEES